MSDAGDEVEVDAPAQVEVSNDAPKGKLSVEDALQVGSDSYSKDLRCDFERLSTDPIQQVLKNAMLHDGLARGLRECAKALDKRQAHLCVLVETVTEAEYLKLIEALCNEHKINLIKVGDAKVLGTWVGLCKIDKEGNPRKIVGCSCVVVKDYGVESEGTTSSPHISIQHRELTVSNVTGLHVLLDYFKNR